MKKVLLSLALMSLAIGLIVPMMASAQIAPDSCVIRVDAPLDICPGACDTKGDVCDYDATTTIGTAGAEITIGAQCCLFSTIENVINWLFMAVMIIVVILILLGAFTLVTASGSEEGVKKGRNYIVFALVGVAVALLARAFPYLIKSIMGF